jgi:hypothetical protein
VHAIAYQDLQTFRKKLKTESSRRLNLVLVYAEAIDRGKFVSCAGCKEMGQYLQTAYINGIFSPPSHFACSFSLVTVEHSYFLHRLITQKAPLWGSHFTLFAVHIKIFINLY